MEAEIRNPDLEHLRDNIPKPDNEVLIQNINSLENEFKNIHAIFLTILLIGHKIIRNICLFLTGTPNSILNSNWRDFGAELGLACKVLKCIEYGNYRLFERTSDFTENTLMTYAGNEKANFVEILKALVRMGRFDVVDKILEDSKELLRQVNEKYKEVEHFHSDKGGRFSIIIPKDWERHKRNLPITLSNGSIKYYSEPDSIQIENIDIQPNPRPAQQQQFRYSKLVMLTFAADGEDAARRVMKTLCNTHIENLPIGVLILENHKDVVRKNPELFIEHMFPQMDFVIPVLTEGYFKALTHKHPMSMDSLDERYIQFIHNKMLTNYTQNRCINQNVRCIIPDLECETIFSMSQFKNDSILKAWIRESRFAEELLYIFR